MREVFLFALIATLASGPVLAQPANGQNAGSSTTNHARRLSRSPGAPIDRGPYTPEANRAYQGGGVILQGAPGAPAPMPEPTPSGQAPRNAVPPP